MTAKRKKNSKKKKNYIERQLLISDPSKSRFGWLDGWLVRQRRGGGGSSRSNLKNQFRFSVPNLLSCIKSGVGKDQTKDKTDNYFCRAS